MNPRPMRSLVQSQLARDAASGMEGTSSNGSMPAGTQCMSDTQGQEHGNSLCPPPVLQWQQALTHPFEPRPGGRPQVVPQATALIGQRRFTACCPAMLYAFLSQ